MPKIVVADTSTLPATLPFDVVIGPYLDANNNVTIERMTVTKVTSSTNTLTVTRAVGGTSKHVHPLSAPVMSTPMNILTSVPAGGAYVVGDQEQMCIAQGPIDNGDGTFYIWVIDIGDGLIIGGR